MNRYRQYPDLKMLGEAFTDHLMAMTSEKLHEKCDIAAELAWRDNQIAELLTMNNRQASTIHELMQSVKQHEEAQSAATPIARILHWDGPPHFSAPAKGPCARTYAELPRQDGKNGHWRESGIELYLIADRFPDYERESGGVRDENA